MHRVMML